MIRAWRHQPGMLLIAFEALDALTFAVTRPAEHYARLAPITLQLTWSGKQGVCA
jgi:hypothetical protein